MKKVFLLMSMAATMFAFAGCQKNEQEAPVNPNESGSTFEFVAEIAQTKTTLDAKSYEVEWEAEDVIYMVTAGEDTPWATAAEFTYADGKFNTETELAAGNYTMNALYAASSQAQYHKNTGTTHKLQSVQTQDCENPTAHIKANDALVGTFTATVPMVETAVVNMNHIYTLMQVDVKNNTGAEINITKFEMTVPGADLAGIFTVDFETAGVETASGAAETITVNVEKGTVAAGGSLPVYFVAAPFTSDAEKGVEFKVTTESGATYTKTAKVALTFNAGEYNTTPYTIKEADVVEPEQPSSWVLTDLAQIKAGDQVVIVSTKSGSSYAMSNDKAASDAPTAVKVTVSNSMLSETPADNLIWHFDVANNQYTFYKDSGKKAWLYCTNTNNGVRVGTNTDKVFEIKDDYLYHVVQKRYLGVYNAQDWRCYTSINNNITGQTLQFYVKTIGVETPDVPKIPELTITPELVEVPAAGGNADFSYEVVNPIEGISVSASTTVDWIADFDYTTPNKVTFTVTENTLEEAREAVIKLDYEGAESKTVTVKQDAKVPEGMLVDVLTRETTGVTRGSQSYSSWSDKTLTSPAVYAGNSAGSNDAIQLRSNNNNSGVVTTTSGGYVKKITVEWQSSTQDNRILDVYGKNTAYTAATDLYNTSTQGTKLGSIKKGASTELLITGDYKYIGLRSNDGAMYLSEIAITWSAESSGETPEQPETPAAPVLTITEKPTSDIAAEGDVVTVKYSVTNPVEGKSVTASANQTWVNNFDYSVDGEVSFVVDENTGAERTATVTLAYEGAMSKTVTISQAAAQSGGDEPEQPGAKKTYTLTISASDFNSTSYAANNNEKTSIATATDGSTLSVKWTSNQVMLGTGANAEKMQWQKSKGYIYNSTDLGSIEAIEIASSAGTYTQNIGGSQQPTSKGDGGYFNIKIGGATGYSTKVTITFTK